MLTATNPADTNPRTLADAKAALKALGMSINRRDGEYRVNRLGASEIHAYYTNDLGDAVETGRLMAKLETVNSR